MDAQQSVKLVGTLLGSMRDEVSSKNSVSPDDFIALTVAVEQLLYFNIQHLAAEQVATGKRAKLENIVWKRLPSHYQSILKQDWRDIFEKDGEDRSHSE